MAIASPALALASTDAQKFVFPARQLFKAQVRFYTDALASAGAELGAAAGGSRTLTVTNTVQVHEPGNVAGYLQRNLASSINGGSQACNGATWYEFSLSDGSSEVEVAATGGADPGGAVSYRIILDVEEGP